MLSKLRRLIKDKSQVFKTFEGVFNPLNIAASEGYIEIVKILLDNGAKSIINSNNNEGHETALYASCRDKHTDIALLLLVYGADPNIPFGTIKLELVGFPSIIIGGDLPIHWAAKNGDEKLVKALLDYGSKVNFQDGNGWTPLIQAVSSKNINIVKMLLEKGAETNLKDTKGRTALSFAIEKNCDEIVELLKEPVESEGGTTGTVADIDGNVYHTVIISTQTWMVENLKTTKYRNGDPIPNVTNGTQWSNLTTDAYCNYNNDINYVNTYGRLYNWYAVTDSRNVCPTGWHVPTDAEWTRLTNFLGGESMAGNKLKESGTTHWNSPNTGATNETGFTALPGGYRKSGGSFTAIDNYNYGYWWSATESGTYYAWYQSMGYGFSDVLRYYYYKEVGFSVRCVKN